MKSLPANKTPEPLPTRRGVLGAGASLLGASTLGASAPAFDETRPGRTKHTRFAVNVEMWWTELPFLDRVRKAAELGFPAIELWPAKGKDIAALAELTAELEIDVAQFTAWGFERRLNDPANHGAFEEAIGKACEVARTLGAKRATVVAGDDRSGIPKKRLHEQVIEGLRRVATTAATNDVTLILEPMNVRVDHPGHCLYGSEDAIAICREVASTHVKINWDLYHMQISEGDLCGHLADGFDQIGYVQLADHPGRNEPGTGEIHYPRVLKKLAELGYEGYVGLECRPRVSELDAARAVARADAW